MFPRIRLFLLFSLLAFASALSAQEQIKESLFKEAQTILKDAEKVEAALYSPSYFQKGYELYKRAEKDFEAGKKLDDIRKRLREAAVELKKAIEVTRISRLTLEDLTQARKAAIQSQTADYAPELFQKAEEVFRKAAQKIEDGNTKDAKKIALEGIRLYRDAELVAIKNRILKEVRETLAECEKEQVRKYAPITFDRATELVSQAEQILEEDRYNQEQATDLAEEAAYEARHALFLANVIRQLQEQKGAVETFILDVENQFQKVAESLNLQIEFDAGFQPPALKLVEAILALRQTNADQHKKIAELQQTVNELSAELTNLKTGQLQELSGKLSELERIVNAEKEAKRKFERIQSLFSPEEAKVIQEGDKIIIRLYGIDFPSGRAIIDPKYFPLLTRVISAIETYPESHVQIEGHTDSRGSNQVNERLSTERANAVLQYILANSQLDPNQVTAIGYGEDRPIASNDTPEGRSLNRRIDVVILPKK